MIVGTGSGHDIGCGKFTRPARQFFRCFREGRKKDWDPCDETADAFFVGFYFPMIVATRQSICNWNTQILFYMTCCERYKREFDKKIFPDEPYYQEPDLVRDERVASVFFGVLQARRAQRVKHDENNSPAE